MWLLNWVSLKHMTVWVTGRNYTVIKGSSELCSERWFLCIRSWNCNFISSKDTLILRKLVWNANEVSLQSLHAIVASHYDVMSRHFASVWRKRAGQSEGIWGWMGGLHQLTNRKFSEHFVLSQVHKLELLFGAGIYAYENQTWHYSWQLDWSHFKISTNCPWIDFPPL